MKLMIELDEMEYSLLKECAKSENYSAITRIIANGIPYEERPKGEWKLISMGLEYKYQCSLCGRTISTTPMFLADYPFCHCGADMRKGDKE